MSVIQELKGTLMHQMQGPGIKLRVAWYHLLISVHFTDKLTCQGA